MLEFRNTKHQIARGTRPDAEVGGKLYLIKNVSALHATYQVRLLVFFALRDGKTLTIRVPKHFKPRRSLRRLMEEQPGIIRIERV